MYIYQTTTAYSSFNFDSSTTSYYSYSSSNSGFGFMASRSGQTSEVWLNQNGSTLYSVIFSSTYRGAFGTVGTQGASESGSEIRRTFATGQNEVRTGSAISSNFSFYIAGSQSSTIRESASGSGSTCFSDGTILSNTNQGSAFSSSTWSIVGFSTTDAGSSTAGSSYAYSSSTTYTYSAIVPSSTTQTLSRKITTSTTSEYGYILSTMLSGSIITTESSTSQYNILRSTSTNDFTVTIGTTSSTSIYSPYLLANVYKPHLNWSLGYTIGYLATVTPKTLFRKSELLLETAETTIPQIISSNKRTITKSSVASLSYTGSTSTASLETTTYTEFQYPVSEATKYYWSSSGVSQSTFEQYISSTGTFISFYQTTGSEQTTLYVPTSTREGIIQTETTTTIFGLTGSANDTYLLSGAQTQVQSTYSSIYGLPYFYTSSYSASTSDTGGNANGYTALTTGTEIYEEEDYNTSTFFNYLLIFGNDAGTQKSFILKRHGDLVNVGNELYLPDTSAPLDNLGYLEITNPLSFYPAFNYISYGPTYPNYSDKIADFRFSADALYSYSFNMGTYEQYGFDLNGRVVPELAQSSYSFLFNDDETASTYKSVTISYSSSGRYFYTLATSPTTRTESTFEFSYGNKANTMYATTAYGIEPVFFFLYDQTTIGGGKQMLYGSDYGSFLHDTFTRNIQSFIYDTYGVTSNSARRSFLYTKITNSSGGTTSGTTEYSAFSSSSVSNIEAYENLYDGWQLYTNPALGAKFPTPVAYPTIYRNLEFYSQDNASLYPRASSFSLKTSGYYSSAFTTFR